MYWSDYENLRNSKAEQGIQMPSIERLILDALTENVRLLREQIVHFVASHTAILPWEVNGRIAGILSKLCDEYKIARDYEAGYWYLI